MNPKIKNKYNVPLLDENEKVPSESQGKKKHIFLMLIIVHYYF